MLQFGHKTDMLDGAIPAPVVELAPDFITADAGPAPIIELAARPAAPVPLIADWPATRPAEEPCDAPPLSTSAQAAGGLKPAMQTTGRVSALGPLAALAAHAAIVLAILVVLPRPGSLDAPRETVIELEIINSPAQVAVSEGEQGQEPEKEPNKIAVELPPPAPEPVFPKTNPVEPPVNLAVQLPPPAPEPVFAPPVLAPPPEPEAPALQEKPQKTPEPAPDFRIELPPPAPDPVFALAPPPATNPPEPDPRKLDQERQRVLAQQRAKERAQEQAQERERDRARERAREIARKKVEQQKARAADQKRAREQAEARRRAGEAARAQQASRLSAGRVAAAGYTARVVGKLRGAQYYPPAARARSAKGVAVVSFSIATSGAATGIRIARSSGDRDLDLAAIGTVRRASPFPPPPPGASRTFAAPMRFSVR